MSGADFTAEALRIARARSGGRCEGCGRAGVRLEAHHALYRSHGGPGTAGNCRLLCGSGNHSGCHGIAHTGRGEELGFSVRSGGDPERVPMQHARFGPVFLTDAGLVLAAEGSACWDHYAVGPTAGCGRCALVGRVLWDFEEEKGWADDS